MKYTLTEEGREYLEKGMPEEMLIEILKNKKTISLSEAKDIFKEKINIAINWAKKNEWIKIEKDKIILQKIPEIYKHKTALKRIAEGKEVDENLINILLSRNLIKEVREDIYSKAENQIKLGTKILTPELLQSGLWRKVKFSEYDVSIIGNVIYRGKRHPYIKFLNFVRRKLISLGFKEMAGQTIELEFWNFDALFQAQDHPSRDWTQTFSLKYPKLGKLPEKNIVENVKKTHENGWITGSLGWGYKWDEKKASRFIPRAHATACSARQLAYGIEIPGKYFAIKRCFRPDVIDATHSVEFSQCEGIIIDENLSFRDMLGILKTIISEITGIKEFRFKPDYYPFTEPSVEVSGKHPKLGWIEIAGAGIFREEVTIPLGINATVLAWGIGIDRLAMIKLGVNDIRELFTKNLKWLREKEVLFV